jgi:hypothetical protein
MPRVANLNPLFSSLLIFFPLFFFWLGTIIEVRQESAALFLNVRYRGPNARDGSIEVRFS